MPLCCLCKFSEVVINISIITSSKSGKDAISKYQRKITTKPEQETEIDIEIQCIAMIWVLITTYDKFKGILLFHRFSSSQSHTRNSLDKSHTIDSQSSVRIYFRHWAPLLHPLSLNSRTLVITMEVEAKRGKVTGRRIFKMFLSPTVTSNGIICAAWKIPRWT